MKYKVASIIVLGVGVVFGLWWLTTTVFAPEAPSTPFTMTPEPASPTPVGETTKPTPKPSGVLFTDKAKVFTFNHPAEFAVTEGAATLTQDWMQGTSLKGQVYATMLIPRTFEPKTNFSEAKFTVGASSDTSAVSNCLVEDNGSMMVKKNVSINGVLFTQFSLRDAGAGNFYDTTSYRTVRDSKCYVVEYTIHTTNIGNYSPDQGISEFDRKKVEDVLSGVVNSFTFLSK